MGESIGTMEDPHSLVPWARNPKDPEAFERKVVELMGSIEKLGFGSPIVARTSDRCVAIGNTRLEAAKRLKLAEVPVRWIELDDDRFGKLALADNKLGENPGWDADALNEILFELGGAPGFDDIASKNEVVLRELTHETDAKKGPAQFWLSIRGPLLQQADVIEELRRKLTLDGCVVSGGVVK